MDDFEDAGSSQSQSHPFSTRSRGRYGSRSYERSLQHPQYGFHNPLKSLSPLAERLALEADQDTGKDFEDVEGLERFEELEEADTLPITKLLEQDLGLDIALEKYTQEQGERGEEPYKNEGTSAKDRSKIASVPPIDTITSLKTTRVHLNIPPKDQRMISDMISFLNSGGESRWAPLAEDHPIYHPYKRLLVAQVLSLREVLRKLLVGGNTITQKMALWESIATTVLHEFEDWIREEELGWCGVDTMVVHGIATMVVQLKTTIQILQNLRH